MSVISIVMLTVLGIIRAFFLIVMSIVSISFLRKVDDSDTYNNGDYDSNSNSPGDSNDPDDTWSWVRKVTRIRRINPSIQSGLLLISSAGVGMGLLIVRQVLLMIYNQSPWWFLLHRDPDLVGEVGYSLCSTLAAIGVVLTVRGLRAVIIPSLNNSGDMPNPLKPNWSK